jgi:uncharacterized damage-inducible protein DinB
MRSTHDHFNAIDERVSATLQSVVTTENKLNASNARIAERRSKIVELTNASELEQVLAGDSAHTEPAKILEGLSGEAAHARVSGAPRTVYEELWHIVFWQQMTLDWVCGIETPYPLHASDPFPTAEEAERESWEQLRQRFLETNAQAVAIVRDASRLEVLVSCPSRPGLPARTMTVREQLESLGAHSAYHFGRVVLMRQLLGAWPPPSGGFTW